MKLFLKIVTSEHINFGIHFTSLQTFFSGFLDFLFEKLRHCLTKETYHGKTFKRRHLRVQSWTKRLYNIINYD